MPIEYGYNGVELQVTTFTSNSDTNAVEDISFRFSSGALAPFATAAALVSCLVTATVI